MSKRAFTLIELLISVALMSIVILFLYKSLSQEEILNKILTKKDQRSQEEQQLYRLFFNDLFLAKSIRIEKILNKDYNILFINTYNSLHDIPFAYVVYYVNAKKRSLIRLESAYPFKLPVTQEQLPYIFADKLVEDVKKLRLFQSQKYVKNSKPILAGQPIDRNSTKNYKRSYLLFLEYKDKTLLLELYK